MGPRAASTTRPEPEGRVLRSLLDGEIVPESTPVPRGEPVVISRLNEATATSWGCLYVGRARISLAPLTPDQRQARSRHSGVGAVDRRQVSSLKALRMRHRGAWLWELRNVHVDDIWMDDVPVQELPG